jgi:hypothetical protein
MPGPRMRRSARITAPLGTIGVRGGRFAHTYQPRLKPYTGAGAGNLARSSSPHGVDAADRYFGTIPPLGHAQLEVQ